MQGERQIWKVSPLLLYGKDHALETASKLHQNILTAKKKKTYTNTHADTQTRTKIQKN